MKHIRHAALWVLLACAPVGAAASVSITEIMYDIEGTDTGREWIEIWNDGNAAVDLSTWKLFEANVNHKVTAVGASSVPAQGYAVIADNPDRFKIDNPGYSGPLFDSAFSLSGEGEALVLRDGALADIDSVTYDPAVGATGDGTTLQKASAGWISAMPTPGSATTATESYHPQPAGAESGSSEGSSSSSSSASAGTGSSGESVSGETVESSAHSGQAAATVSKYIPEFGVSAGRQRIGFVGSPLPFEAKVKVAKNLQSGGLFARWALGDGTEATGNVIQHSYRYPGDYTVILNASMGGEEAVSRISVRIVEPAISFATDGIGFAEVTNASDTELNIGGWIIETKTTRYVIPRDTLVAPKASLKIPFSAAGIAYADGYIRIANAAGTILSHIESALEKVSSSTEVVLPEGLDIQSIIERFKTLAGGDL